MTKTETKPASARVTDPPFMRYIDDERRAHSGTAR